MKDSTKHTEVLSDADTPLVEAAQEGDRSAFDQLVIRHKDRLFGLCYWFVGDYHDATECAQESFLRAYRSLKKFRRESKFSTWLYRIAVNVCKNRLSSSHYRIQQKMSPLGNPGTAGEASSELEDESLSPMMALEKMERLRLIRDAMDSLSAEQKMVVTLCDIEGFSYEEISQLTGINLGTIKSRLARARGELKEKLRGII
jgi:RNA polymerase sigma-70 factor (ECF subfamily)